MLLQAVLPEEMPREVQVAQVQEQALLLHQPPLLQSQLVLTLAACWSS